MNNSQLNRQLVQCYLAGHLADGAEPTPAQIEAAHTFAAEYQAMAVVNYAAKELGLSVKRERNAQGEEVVVFSRVAAAVGAPEFVP